MAKKLMRQTLIARRLQLSDRAQRCAALQNFLQAWLRERGDLVVGAYWPIQGEFDPLPALQRWQAAGALLAPPQLRRVGLPVVEQQHKSLSFHTWYPGCAMGRDHFGIPQPLGTALLLPTLLLVPCVGYGPQANRLGYGGGFYDRTLHQLQPKPFVLGLAFSCGFVRELEPEPHDQAMDAILNEFGVRAPLISR